MCVCVCVCVCVCSQASRSRAMDSFVFKQQVLFRVDFLSVTLDHRVPQDGARGQNLGHLKISFFLLLLFFSYVINHI